MIVSDQEFVTDVDKIIFEFIWKGKDKVKCSVLVSDIIQSNLSTT